jgi:hypothetical protein
VPSAINFLDQPGKEGDIVGALRRRAAGAIGIGAEIGPGAIEPVGKHDTELLAPGDFRPRGSARDVGAGLGIAMQDDNQRRRPGVRAQNFVSANGAVDIDGLGPGGPRAACNSQENGKSKPAWHDHGSLILWAKMERDGRDHKPFRFLDFAPLKHPLRFASRTGGREERNGVLCMGLFSIFLVGAATPSSKVRGSKWLIIFVPLKY